MKASIIADVETTAGTIPAGTIFEGEEAVRMVQAGWALPLVEKRTEKALPKSPALEVR